MFLPYQIFSLIDSAMLVIYIYALFFIFLFFPKKFFCNNVKINYRFFKFVTEGQRKLEAE